MILDRLKTRIYHKSMEATNPSNFQGYSKQELFALFREFLEEYYKQKEKELYELSLIERIVRVEEELKALRNEQGYRFEVLVREMNARFEAQKRESDARFEAIMSEQRALREEMNARFEAQKRESDARFEAIMSELRALREEMNARFEAQMRESDARFEAQKRESDARFEAIMSELRALREEMNARFEALEKRFNFLQWFMMLGFTFLSVLIALFSFLKG